MREHETIPYSLETLPDDESITRARALRDRLKERRTCRYFSDEPVPREVIEAAIEAAGTAPNGANHQPWHFAVVSSPDKKRAIREAAEAEERRFYGADGDNPKASDEWLGALKELGTDEDKPFLETAPYLIVVFAQRKGGIEEDGGEGRCAERRRCGLQAHGAGLRRRGLPGRLRPGVQGQGAAQRLHRAGTARPAAGSQGEVR